MSKLTELKLKAEKLEAQITKRNYIGKINALTNNLQELITEVEKLCSEIKMLEETD